MKAISGSSLLYAAGIPFVIATLLAMSVRSSTPSASPLILKTPKELPSVLRMLLLFVLGKKSGKKLAPGELKVVVQNHPVAKLKAHFDKICGPNSKSATLYLLPHCICQGVLLGLLNHTHFPVALIGSVHLKSSFTIHDADRLYQLLETEAKTSEVTAAATYSGTVTTPKGLEVYVTLTLSETNGGKELWREVFVIFKVKRGAKGGNNKEEVAKEVGSAIMDTQDTFKNLAIPEGGNTKPKHLSVSPKETWEFGTGFGDVNPIHMVGWMAMLFGQKGRIVHGMHGVSKALVYADKTFGGEGPQGSSSSSPIFPSPKTWFVSMKAPIPVGSPVNVNAQSQGPIAGTSMDIYIAGSSRPSICIRPAPASSL